MRGLRTAQTAGRRQSGQSGGRIGSTSNVAGVVVVVEAHDDDSAASSTATANGRQVKNHFNEDDVQSNAIAAVHTWQRRLDRLHVGRVVVGTHKRSAFL